MAASPLQRGNTNWMQLCYCPLRFFDSTPASAGLKPLSSKIVHHLSSSHPTMFAVASLTIFTRVATLSGTPGGGNERFLGGGERR